MNKIEIKAIIRQLRKAGRHNKECPSNGKMLTHHYYHGKKKIKRLKDEDWFYGEIDRALARYLADKLSNALAD